MENSRSSSPIEFIGKKIARWILYILGWKNLSDQEAKTIKILKQNQRLILPISHTSTLDGLIFMLYKFANPDVFQNNYIVIKPQIFDAVPKMFHPILNKVGFIKATAYEDKNGGFIRSTIEKFKDKNEFMLMISPKGKMIKSDWRSGYYIIAKKLNCKIAPCGLDYDLKKILFYEPFGIDGHSKEEIDEISQIKLAKITPLHIKNSEYSLQKLSTKNTLISFSFLLIILIIFLTYLNWNYKILFFVFIVLLFLLI
jgi:hypothetical protein